MSGGSRGINPIVQLCQCSHRTDALIWFLVAFKKSIQSNKINQPESRLLIPLLNRYYILSALYI